MGMTTTNAAPLMGAVGLSSTTAITPSPTQIARARPRRSWSRKEPTMDVKPTNLVSIKAQDSATFTIQGYGVVFGGRDLAGNHFSDKTDFLVECD